MREDLFSKVVTDKDRVSFCGFGMAGRHECEAAKADAIAQCANRKRHARASMASTTSAISRRDAARRGEGYSLTDCVCMQTLRDAAPSNARQGMASSSPAIPFTSGSGSGSMPIPTACAGHRPHPNCARILSLTFFPVACIFIHTGALASK